jgi:hypothetical protein
MKGRGTYRLAYAWQNWRLAKRLGKEIYVVGEPSATPLRNYTPQSSLPLTLANEVLSSPSASIAFRFHHRQSLRALAPKHFISGGFSS